MQASAVYGACYCVYNIPKFISSANPLVVSPIAVVDCDASRPDSIEANYTINFHHTANIYNILPGETRVLSTSPLVLIVPITTLG